jgi:hypothetical protein
MNKKNKTVTVKFTAAEAEWLIAELDRRALEGKEKAGKATHTAEHDSYLLLKFQAEALRDRIRSEQ